MKKLLPLLLLAGCVTAHIPVPEAGGTIGPEELPRLREGRELYINRCSSCHGLYDVERYTDREWGGHVQDMIREARVKVTPEERADLLFYLTRLNGRE